MRASPPERVGSGGGRRRVARHGGGSGCPGGGSLCPGWGGVGAAASWFEVARCPLVEVGVVVRSWSKVGVGQCHLIV